MIDYFSKEGVARSDVSESRRELIEGAAAQIRKIYADRGSADLVFVCTHNSRRSQFGQVWAAIAAANYGLKIQCHSCGTEATACNERTISALERAGLSFSKDDVANPAVSLTLSSGHANPVYSLVLAAPQAKLRLFSKAFGHPSLPQKNFVALMCCDDADKNCPVVNGAIARIPLWYVDPKASDGKPDEATVYDGRCKQIAAEMFYLMQLVAKDHK
ncbi:MAG: protein-tyrosine-phosphatase [Pirellulaceae bacterium]|nr:protein-tyrosine-phosphatase [Pirellulaceae bacterium]